MQFGFRSGHSTEHALTFLSDHISKNLDDSKYTCGVLLDLSKAFDTVNHEILLQKLKRYGIRGTALNWIENYLSERYQFIDANKVNSKL